MSLTKSPSAGMRYRAISTVAVAILVGATGCRIKAPTVEEQKELTKRGAFPSGVPGWMSAASGVHASGGSGGGGGLIPHVFSSPGESVSGNAQQQAEMRRENDEALERAREEQEKQRTQDDRSTKPTDSSGKAYGAKDKESPLDRILSACPGIESQVNDALTTIDTDQRISKYIQLTNRCPQSWDLWLWLGKDYEKRNKLVQASRCYEKSLILNSQNEEAEKLLAASRKQLSNESMKDGGGR